MDNVIKNSYLITDERIRSRLGDGARAHLRFNRLVFKIKSIEDDRITVQVVQEKNPNGNYLTKNRLVEVTRELFGKHYDKVIVHPIPYSAPPADDVTPEWVIERIKESGRKNKDIAKDLGISNSELSAYANRHKAMSIRVRSMFYYYFEWLKLKRSSQDCTSM